MADICVYCSSSNAVDSTYVDLAKTFGEGLGRRGHTLIYGGGDVGLMGATARSATEHGARVVGVIPERLQEREGLYTLADELIVTQTMSERKQTMFQRADAFTVLPGGYGTMEEFMEVLTLQHLGYHSHPITLVSPGGFYDTLLEFFDELYTRGFARVQIEETVSIVDTADDALDVLEHLGE